MNILNLYYVLLNSIATEKPKNFEILLQLIGSDSNVVDLRQSIGDADSIEYLQDILEDLIHQDLVKGRKLNVDGGRYFVIDRLSPTGYEYLKKLKDKGFLDKLKKHAKENGISPTVGNISKLIANIIWD